MFHFLDYFVTMVVHVLYISFYLIILFCSHCLHLFHSFHIFGCSNPFSLFGIPVCFQSCRLFLQRLFGLLVFYLIPYVFIGLIVFIVSSFLFVFIVFIVFIAFVVFIRFYRFYRIFVYNVTTPALYVRHVVCGASFV